MEGALLIALYVAWKWMERQPRYEHWRGPQTGDRASVQEAHLWLFQFPPADNNEEDDRD